MQLDADLQSSLPTQFAGVSWIPFWITGEDQLRAELVFAAGVAGGR